MLVDIDFETASAEDLKLVGAWPYAESATTEILCLNWSVDDGPKRRWFPGDSTEELCTLAADPRVVFVAHHAGFEQAIWHYKMVLEFGLPPVPVERWEDTMATCAWKAIALKLEKAAQAVRLPIEKDMEGNRLTLSMSRPNKKTGMYPERTPEVLTRIGDYCDQDVAVEGALRKRIGLLKDQSPHERGIWLLDQKINQRGIRVDLAFVEQAQRVVDRATVPLLAEFRDLTSGINPGQVQKIIQWAEFQGEYLKNLQKGYLEELLGEEEVDGYESNAGEDDDAVLPDVQMSGIVRRVLQIRQMLGSASIKKLKKMRSCVCSDGRARYLLQYHAANTGRWGGRLLQPQNFPRGTLKVSPAEAVDAIMTGDPEYVEMVLGAPAIECVASSLRHALVPDKDKLFLVGDFVGIEARIVLALAGQHDKTMLIAAGQNPYFDFGQLMFGRPIEKDNLADYIPAKAGVLGCGFQCGPNNFNLKFLGGKDLPMAEEVVRTYRKDWAPRVPGLWYGLERVAMQAVRDEVPQEAFGVAYRCEGDWLTATLPSGWQRIWYHRPELFRDEKFDKDAWHYNAYKGGKLTQVKAYGGLLTENVVQGLARGLLCASMMRLERAGFPIVLTVHDEVVCEVPENGADLDRFEQIMAEPTAWSERIGIPIAVEAWQGRRYKK